MPVPICGSTTKILASVHPDRLRPKERVAYFPPERPGPLRYTLCMAQGLRAKPGDVVHASLAVVFTCREFYVAKLWKERRKKVPGGLQINVMLRVAPALPPTVVNESSNPAQSDGGTLGFSKSGGVTFTRDYGLNMTADGVVLDLNGDRRKFGNPYHVETRDVKFVVESRMIGNPSQDGEGDLWLLGWCAPESDNADGDSYVNLPSTSNYSLLNFLRFTDA